MEVKYIHDGQLETAAFKLLVEYGVKYGEIRKPPIPVEEIIESYLQLDYGFDDLSKLLNTQDVLGATWVKLKKICIDQSLDPSVDSGVLGRYRFTAAHEIGHWQLHRAQLLEDDQNLFETIQKPAIVCRKVFAKQPIEIQADRFASFLLMPKHIVQNEWQLRYGSLEPYNAVAEISDINARFGQTDRQPTTQVAKQLAKVFNVSGQAMQIRLVNLGLILTKRPEMKLF
ncbi:MAG: ImmA/IrrE family metallo-endopeptidase [Phycisphaerales bacterium]